MDIVIEQETLLNDRDYRWLASPHNALATQPATILLANTVEATHWPNGHIKRGTVLGKFTGGPNAGLFAPYVDDWSDVVNTGLDTPAAIVVDGFKVRKDSAGAAVSTVVSGAVVLAGVPLQLNLDYLPGLLLEDGTTAYTIVAADLASSGWVVVDHI